MVLPNSILQCLQEVLCSCCLQFTWDGSCWIGLVWEQHRQLWGGSRSDSATFCESMTTHMPSSYSQPCNVRLVALDLHTYTIAVLRSLERSGLVWCGVNKMVNVNRHCTKPLSTVIYSPLLVLVIHNTLQCAYIYSCTWQSSTFLMVGEDYANTRAAVPSTMKPYALAITVVMHYKLLWWLPLTVY